MRTREKIEEDRDAARLSAPASEDVIAVLVNQRLQLEVMLDIRDQLVKHAEDIGRCDHGNTGICMTCVIVNDLLRPRG